MYVTLFLLVE
ncbi:hypothetical protein Zm00014a_002353 [Zea mays]|uniref:Uncharacterized protein n=1 Tax=Zea mays TaxID=4577 RepID=A0A3L6G3V1_MAIZE|nr:hypothetical protein Zm00014a_002353 [Zea mays]